ncbi:MAG: MraY family glycosyltransferase [Candidatus Omnitrophota bacterium]
MLINYLIIILSGFLSGIFFIALLKKPALKYKILVPQGIPLIGGITMGISFLVACLIVLRLYGGLPQKTWGMIAASFIMLAFGIIDDWKELSILAKFTVQIIAASLLVLSGTRTQIVNIGNTANIIITFLWLLGISNAFNHLDIMDGLAAGAAIIVSCSFLTISILNNDIQNAILSLALSGVILSLLIYNLPPAKIYMGNAGSHFLGFILAAYALAISYAPLERKAALFSPLLILGLPIFDTAFLILVRIMRKKLPFKKSNDHLALLFLAAGYSKKRILWIMFGLGAFFSLCGILISQASNQLGLAVIVGALMIGLVITKKMSRVAVNG